MTAPAILFQEEICIDTGTLLLINRDTNRVCSAKIFFHFNRFVYPKLSLFSTKTKTTLFLKFLTHFYGWPPEYFFSQVQSAKLETDLKHFFWSNNLLSFSNDIPCGSFGNNRPLCMMCWQVSV